MQEEKWENYKQYATKKKLVNKEIKEEIRKYLNKWRRRQDGGLEGLELTSSHKNNKIKTTAEQPLTKKTQTYQKRYSTSKDKEVTTVW